MNISAKTDYALRTILELSLHWPNPEPMIIHDIARAQKIPIKYLTQIVLHLKALGLVKSIRGKQGGYLLTKAPSQITLADVMQGNVMLSNKIRSVSSINDVLNTVEQGLMNQLKAINFDEIAHKQRNLAKTPMYSI